MTFLRKLFGGPQAPVAREVIEEPIPQGGPYRVEVVGESNYQKELARFSGPKTPDGVGVYVTAWLVPEPNNPHDRNAVSVRVRETVVAYLPREVAPTYHKAMGAIGKAGESLAVKARIHGGWKRPGDEGSYAITLYMPKRGIGPSIGVNDRDSEL